MSQPQLARVVSSAVRADVEASQAPEDLLSKPSPLNFKEDDVFSAWELISPAGHSALTKSQVLDGLRLFFPHISAREVKDLVGPGNLSVDKLRNLLFHADVPAFDPNMEAFKIIDPHGTGYVDAHVLRRLLQQMPGLEYLDDADMDLIMQVADVDKDGHISLKDFATIGSWAPPREVATDAIRRMMVERLQREDSRRR